MVRGPFIACQWVRRAKEPHKCIEEISIYSRLNLHLRSLGSSHALILHNRVLLKALWHNLGLLTCNRGLPFLSNLWREEECCVFPIHSLESILDLAGCFLKSSSTIFLLDPSEYCLNVSLLPANVETSIGGFPLTCENTVRFLMWCLTYLPSFSRTFQKSLCPPLDAAMRSAIFAK